MRTKFETPVGVVFGIGEGTSGTAGKGCGTAAAQTRSTDTRTGGRRGGQQIDHTGAEVDEHLQQIVQRDAARMRPGAAGGGHAKRDRKECAERCAARSMGKDRIPKQARSDPSEDCSRTLGSKAPAQEPAGRGSEEGRPQAARNGDSEGVHLDSEDIRRRLGRHAGAEERRKCTARKCLLNRRGQPAESSWTSFLVAITQNGAKKTRGGQFVPGESASGMSF